MLNKAVIDLSILTQNALSIKNKLKSGVKFNAVVKADAYGHGAPTVANALYGLVDSYSVALLEEGVQLRLSGIDKEIILLIPPFNEDIEKVVFYGLTPAVESIESVRALERECIKQNRRISVHVKFNSGMNRLGVDDLCQLESVLKAIKGCKRVNLGGMFSHFACPQNKKWLNIAQNKFLLANNCVKGYNNKATCHISASGGFLAGVQFDMVRIGILLYGYKPYESDFVTVNPVMKVYSPVLKSRVARCGEGVLYGNKRLKGETQASLIRYGYADGLNRKKVSDLLNNRCMDVSAVKGSLFGWQPVMENADALAKEYGTISYEILTKSAMRAEKIYVR